MAGELTEAIGAGGERSVGRAGRSSVGWGEGKDQGAPGTVKDHVGAIGSGGGGGVPMGGSPPPHQTGAVRAAVGVHSGLSSPHSSRSSLISGAARSSLTSAITRKAIGSGTVTRGDSGGGTG